MWTFLGPTMVITVQRGESGSELTHLRVGYGLPESPFLCLRNKSTKAEHFATNIINHIPYNYVIRCLAEWLTSALGLTRLSPLGEGSQEKVTLILIPYCIRY